MTAAILSMLPKPKGRQSAGMPDILKLFPAYRNNRTFIYAIAFKGGVIKVGRTGSPRKRLHDHWKRGSGEVAWVHLFGSMHESTAYLVEKRAPRALDGIARQINGSEWFFSDEGRQRIVDVVREVIARARAEVQLRFDTQEKAQREIDIAKAVLEEAGVGGGITLSASGIYGRIADLSQGA